VDKAKPVLDPKPPACEGSGLVSRRAGVRTEESDMPTKTYRRVSDQEPRPFQPSETELFPIEVCGQMARALGINDPDEITRLHQILNYQEALRTSQHM
jgi:hypothetical protein